MRFKEGFTVETLSNEYAAWVAENGDGRDKQDQRFGQYLVNKYHAGSPFPQLFHRESAAGCYEVALNELYYGDEFHYG